MMEKCNQPVHLIKLLSFLNFGSIRGLAFVRSFSVGVPVLEDAAFILVSGEAESSSGSENLLPYYKPPAAQHCITVSFMFQTESKWKIISGSNSFKTLQGPRPDVKNCV